MGDNAIHKLGSVLQTLADYSPRRVDIDGCEYREGLSAVRIDGGVAGNVVPDGASVDVNFRFAPDRSIEQATDHVRGVFAAAIDSGAVTFEITDAAGGALPGLSDPAAAALVDAAGGRFRAKFGWTDVSRFSALGVPAVNLGPGDPNLAHKRDERVPTAQITEVTEVLRRYLLG
jgi:succinyl-diaminopimelate desuccinylase